MQQNKFKINIELFDRDAMQYAAFFHHAANSCEMGGLDQMRATFRGLEQLFVRSTIKQTEPERFLKITKVD